MDQIKIVILLADTFIFVFRSFIIYQTNKNKCYHIPPFLDPTSSTEAIATKKSTKVTSL